MCVCLAFGRVSPFREILSSLFALVFSHTFVLDLAFAFFPLHLLLSCFFLPFRIVVCARPSTRVVVLYVSVSDSKISYHVSKYFTPRIVPFDFFLTLTVHDALVHRHRLGGSHATIRRCRSPYEKLGIPVVPAVLINKRSRNQPFSRALMTTPIFDQMRHCFFGFVLPSRDSSLEIGHCLHEVTTERCFQQIQQNRDRRHRRDLEKAMSGSDVLSFNRCAR